MFRIELDQAGNGLTIGYAGHVNAGEAGRCAEEVRLALTQLKPGFRLRVDLTELASMDPACSPVIGSIMEQCNARGVSEVVRIVPDPRRDIGLQILSLFHYRNDVRIVTCSSAAEASRLLDS